jgi:hypothetical protein
MHRIIDSTPIHHPHPSLSFHVSEQAIKRHYNQTTDKTLYYNKRQNHKNGLTKSSFLVH